MFNYDKIKQHPNSFQIEENIWLIKNFISEENSKAVLEFAESFSEEDWWLQNKREWWHGKFLKIEDKEMQTLLLKVKNDITDLFEYDWWFNDLDSIHRMQEGQGMFEHSDNPSEDEGKNNYVQVSFVLYISDFEGGEIYYPKLGIEYKPSKGDLLIHPGSSKYTHGVKEVKGKAIRYVLTTCSYDPKVKKIREQGFYYEDVNTGNPVTDYNYTQEAILNKD